MNKLKFIVLMLLPSACLASAPTSAMFGVELSLVSCEWTERVSPQISVMGMDFYLPKNYQFKGISHGAAYFAEMDESGYSARNSIHFYPEGVQRGNDGVDGFKIASWHEVDILYKSSLIGKIEPAVIYHVVIINNEERLSFLSDSTEILTSIVACSKKSKDSPSV